MTEPPPKPHNRFEIEVTASGPTWEDARRNFEGACRELTAHGIQCSMVRGGMGGSATVVVVEDPEMTEERYWRELEEYAKWLKQRDGIGGKP